MADARLPDDVIFMISMVFEYGPGNREALVLALRPADPVCDHSDNYNLVLFDTEFGMLDAFFGMIQDKDPDMIIGYNIFGFDMKYILQRYYSVLRNVPQGGRVSKKRFLADGIIHKSWSSAAYGTRESAIFNFAGRCCFDVYSYATMELTMQKYSLDYVAQQLLGKRKLDMPYREMFRMYKAGKISEIAEYCWVDSVLTLDIWDKLGLWHAVAEQCKLYRVHIHEMYSSGQQKRIFNQLYFYAHRRGYVFDKEKNFRTHFKYEGAHVLEPKPGIYRNCSVVDFASLYPSIIIAQNICYTTLVGGAEPRFHREHTGLVPEILQHLISSRKEVKRLLAAETDPVLKTIYDKRQFAYKVCANSFYGAFGSRDSPYLQMLEGAEAVTRNGRSFLTQAMDMINNHRYGCSVIYGDTDSCFFVSKREDDPLDSDKIKMIVTDINEAFPRPVHVEHEKDIDKLLLLAKKKYVYMLGGRQLAKGVVTARRDTCFWVRELYEAIITMILNDASNDQMIDQLGLNIDYRYYVLHQLKGPVVQLYNVLNWKFEI
ncbi:hypothetical protein EC988_000007 [Linderina pennispora]|nr:hypothetical protein EC988_000007 [Linderina pennispora]